MDNFLLGLKAIGSELVLVLVSLLESDALIGFVLGALFAIVIIGLVISKNPRNISLMIKYSAPDSFEHIASQDSSGTYQVAYSTFFRSHSKIRLLLLLFVAVAVVLVLWLVARYL